MKIALFVACTCLLAVPLTTTAQDVQVELPSGVTVASPPPPAGDSPVVGDIHLGGDDVDTSSTVDLDDSAGFRWDIRFHGCVTYGTRLVYDGGMLIHYQGTRYDEGTTSMFRRTAPGSREIEVGPWTKDILRIYRRVAVPLGKPYCRWIDLFENTTDDEIRPVFRYTIDMRTGYPIMGTTTGGLKVTDKDWGLFTSAPAEVNRPSVCHFYGSKNSMLRPTVIAGKSHLVEYEFTLTIPARKTAALCLFESQHQTADEARKFLTTFDPAAEIASLPESLKAIIANIGPGSPGSPGAPGMDVPRLKDADLLVTRGGTEHHGALEAVPLTVQTSFGKIDLPAQRIIGLTADPMSAAQLRVGLCDGQVVCGQLLSPLPSLKLADGNSVALPLSQVKMLSYRISAERPAAPTSCRPMLVTSGGMRLAFDPNSVDLTLRAPIGTIKLPPQAVQAVYLDTPGGLHRVALGNGSVISGLLDGEKFAPTLELPLKPPTRLSQLTQICYRPPVPMPANAPSLKLRNGDLILGRLKRDLTVKSGGEEVAVPLADLAELASVADTVDTVTVKLHSSKTITGSLVGQTLQFAMDDGPELKIFVAHVATLTNPKPATPTTTAATVPASPLPSPSPAPVERPAETSVLDDLKASLAELAARKAAMEAGPQTKEQLSALAEIAKKEAILKEKIARMSAMTK